MKKHMTRSLCCLHVGTIVFVHFNAAAAVSHPHNHKLAAGIPDSFKIDRSLPFGYIDPKPFICTSVCIGKV